MPGLQSSPITNLIHHCRRD